MKKKGKARDPTVSDLKKKLDNVFSRYIRWRDKWTCYTCGKRGGPGQIQNGHFVSRSSNSLRYDEINCHAQCVGCNMFKSGNMAEYARRLIDDFGDRIVHDLVKKGKEIKQFTTKELQELIDYYEPLVREFENAKRKTNGE